MYSPKKYIQLLLIILITVMGNSNGVNGASPQGSLKGAESKKELTDILFNAVKTNQFNTLPNYIPDEEHLQALYNKSSTVERNLYKELNAELINEKTRENFDLLIKKGIDTELNWESLELIENSEKSGSNQKNVTTIILTVEDNKEKILTFSYDAVIIGGRWFIFQGIRTESNAIGYSKETPLDK